MTETLRTVDGRPILTIERRLAHRPEKVWRALTEPDHLSQWYPFRVTAMDLRVGGEIVFDDGAGTRYTATITQLDPPRVFAFVEHAPASMPRESDDLIRLELRPDGDGCVLVFTHVFDDRPAAASYATGWYGCLEALAQVLAGEPVTWPPMSVERYEAYVAAFGLAEGTSEETADGWQVRYERQLMQQPVERVWAALTGRDDATEQPGAEDTPAVGAPPPAGFVASGVTPGLVTTVEPPTRMEYAWPGERGSGLVRWELSTGPGGARVVVTQTGPAALAQERQVALSAWKTHVEALVAGLLGRGEPWAGSAPAQGDAGRLGTLEKTADGRLALRFVRDLAHPPAKVWRALTDTDHLRTWFPAVVTFDLTPGAKLRFDPTTEQRRRFGLADHDAATGEIIAVEPPYLLEYTWDREVLRWELTPDGDSGCRLVFTNVFDDPDLAASAGAGWHAGLEVVEAQLDGRVVDWSPWNRAEELTDSYVRHFG